MNATAENPEIVTESPRQPASAKIIVHDSSPIAHLMDTGRFEHSYRIARLMARASLIPEHLRIDPKTKQPLSVEEVEANCFLVVNQAFRWEMDPFLVAPETYVVGGKLAFQGKLIAAVINGRARLQARLSYEFSGQKGQDNFTIKVSGAFQGESEMRWVTLSVGEAKTGNQIWTKDPEQKLVYSGVLRWARRYCPEVVMGIISDDEADVERGMRNVTPPTDSIGEAIGNAPSPAPETPAPKPRASRASKPPTETPAATVEADPVAPAAEEKRGRLVAFVKFETRTGEKKITEANPEGGKWKQWLLSYTEDGTEKSAATFSETMGATIEWLEPDAAIRIETEPNKDSRYADTLMFIEADSAGGEQ